MAIATVVPQGKQHRRFHARIAVCLGAAGEGNLIRRGEGYAEKLVAQKIRIGTHRFGGLVTEPLAQLDGQRRAQSAFRQKFHQAAHTCLSAETGGDLLRFPGRDPLQKRHPFRLQFQHIQRFLAEALHQQLCRSRSDAFHRTGGKIIQNPALGTGHIALHSFRLDLHTVGRVVLPFAGDDQFLPPR